MTPRGTEPALGALVLYDRTWTLDGHYTVLTVHVVTNAAEPKAQAAVKQTVRDTLSELGVQHATIEMEQANEICALQDH